MTHLPRSTTDIAAALRGDETAGREPQTLVGALAQLIERVDRGEPIIETIPTGLALLDETTGGLVRGEFAGIVAAPGFGKSTFADALALEAIRLNQDIAALVFALETSVLVRAARLLAGASVQADERNCVVRSLRTGELLRGELRDDDKQLARETASRLSADVGGRLSFVDDVYDAGDIAELIGERRPDLVIVDHLGLVGTDTYAGSSTTERTDDALHVINRAIRDANAAGVLIAEVNKAGLSAGSAGVTAVRGSARFASLAGQLIGIVRDGSTIDGDPRLAFQLHKNRHGRTLVQQAAVLWGGLSFLAWSPSVEPIEPNTGAQGRGNAT